MLAVREAANASRRAPLLSILGVITIAFKKTFADGSSLTLTPTVVEGKLEWKCSAPLPRRMLPSACR